MKMNFEVFSKRGCVVVVKGTEVFIISVFVV
jgi:hypothetical protein